MLQPGYNIVTERVGDTESEYAILLFLRQVTRDAEFDTPVTVTGLDDLFYDVSETDRSEIISDLRQLFRRSRSFSSADAVQFVMDGQLVDDNAIRVRIERSEGGVYLDVGELFVEEPQPMGPTHAVARK